MRKMQRNIIFLVSLLFISVFSSAQSVGEWEEIFDNFSYAVVTASQTYEPVKEAPVPVTVITREQIERMGAKTLKDVLVTVPGFYFVQDHNEVNVSSRGIYASSQQKFAILRDGHRLNTRTYQEANPDHHISLVGVERIEILRGPGGSLYGDVALTGVVNLISQKGADGSKVSVGGGNFGQKQLNVVYGKKMSEESDLLVYAHFFESDGEDIDVSANEDFNLPQNAKAGTVTVNGFRDRPSYDVGLNLKVQNTEFHASKSYCNYLSPRSDGGTTGMVFDRSDYREVRSTSIGLTTETLHAYVRHVLSLSENATWTFDIYYDEGIISPNLVANPAAKTGLHVFWEDWDAGLKSYASIPYSTGFGSGTLLAGVQTEYVSMWNTYPTVVFTPTSLSFLSQDLVLNTGEEKSYAAFMQIKHRFGEKLILNTGFRYDYLERADDETKDEVSPRAALIYLPKENLFFKLSFTRSFEEAPYWYRYNSLPAYQGAASLEPETMDSVQFSVDFKTGNLTNEINFFWNDLQDLVFRDTTIVPSRYNNAGSVETQGIEYELTYNIERFRLRFNYTYLDLKDATVYPSTDDQINNIPEHKANLIADVNLFSNLWFHTGIRYIGERPSPIGTSSTAGYNRNDPAHEEDAVTLVDFKLTWENFITQNMQLGFLIENAFDEEWAQGGSTILPYEQPGRWYFLELSYKWGASE